MKRKRDQRQLRASQPLSSYVEISSEDEYENNASENELEDSSRHRLQSITIRNKHATTSLSQLSPNSKKPSMPHKTAKPIKRPKANNTSVDIFTNPQARIPPWQILPYQILLDIFRNASYPLCDENMRPKASVSWLIDTALVCKSFTEPALTVLYDSPPIPNIHHLRAFLSCLNMSKNSNLNYHNKVRRLITPQSSRSTPELTALIRQIPRLSYLKVIDYTRRPFFSDYSRKSSYKYPGDILLALEETGIRLRHWRWDMHHTSKDDRLADLQKILLSPSFQGLHTLELSEIDFSAKNSDEEAEEMGDLATVIRSLQHVRRIFFRECFTIQSNFLSLLPPALETLKLVGCPKVNSEMLHDYLVVGGRSLTALILSHNQLLDLSFLPDLKACCPKLQSLKVDMQFYVSIPLSFDNKPHFDRLLAPAEIPTWPLSLQNIELLQLRKWEQEAAEGLFQSLLDSAPQLLHLRKLSLYVILSIPFRERATFRTEWIRKLETVFLRRPDPPNPHLMSIDSWKVWKAQQMANEVQGNDELDLVSLSREKKDEPHVSESPSSATKTRRSTRVTQVSKKSNSEEHQKDEENGDLAKNLPSQGLCNIVDIRIDNSKQREEKFTEEDFLDEERSGDDDWDETKDGLEENEYAW